MGGRTGDQLRPVLARCGCCLMVAFTNLRCGQCARLLAKASGYSELQIKCPRCGTMNHMKAQSLPTDRRERLTEGSTDEKRVVAGRCPEAVADPAGRVVRRADH
ncbi:Com family DNA-binding transcriptional regulator [Stenotrophomonas sp.]|uniref:Com family DNA-binding transcriptional regulator n=1 Tax=Stenotrophomonas sp. TaxID=69392 RepID=UPI0028B1D926|nr:Com family DNA-binding transcriptional regulator [Stenotrophomonas sp.]